MPENSASRFSTDMVFVILTYNIVTETVNCVSSIKQNLDTRNFHIIIVDNASPNKAGEKLAGLYRSDPQVTVILNRENAGFARGNNVGIQAAQAYKPKYVCCTNNDTLLPRQAFFQEIDEEYRNHGPAVIGPKILLKDGTVFRMRRFLSTPEGYEKRIAFLQECLASQFKKQDKKSLARRMMRLLPATVRMHIAIRWDHICGILDGNYYWKKTRNVKLHGSCLIFTPAFFQKLDGFYDKTFMYVEEDHLFLDLLEQSLTDVYLPSIRIIHLEDASTNVTFSDVRESNVFRDTHSIDSLKLLVDRLRRTECDYQHFCR